MAELSTVESAPGAGNTATRIAVDCLQKALVETIDLSLQLKQAHWNVIGPDFKPVHEQLDEITDDARTWSDDIAERITALREPADGRVSTVAKATELPEFPAGQIKDDEIVRLCTERLEGAATRIRGYVEATDVEPVTQDLLIGVLAGLEKHLWMMRSQLQR